MAKKKRKGRTSKSGPKSSINADEHPVDIAFKLEQGKREWITPLKRGPEEVRSQLWLSAGQVLVRNHAGGLSREDWNTGFTQ